MQLVMQYISTVSPSVCPVQLPESKHGMGMVNFTRSGVRQISIRKNNRDNRVDYAQTKVIIIIAVMDSDLHMNVITKEN